MRKIFITLFLLVVFFSGCSKQIQSDYPIAVAWNNIRFAISVEEVSKENLGKQLGEVKRIKEPMPKENGDANFITVGSKIFEINGIDANDTIAIEYNGKIVKATKIGSLK
ncbi:MAG: hypothetical protein FH751_00005 [Firmicutes bacterium]|nr:hypothetical protein [Bacillota bacterium]